MRLYDANASFGVDMVNHECVNHENFIVLEKVDIAKDARRSIEYMDYAGIERANVWHRSMYELDPTAGNRKLLEELRGYEDRLSPSLAILPCVTDREYEPNTFFDLMKAHNARTVHAFPLMDRYILCEVTMGEQLALLSELRIPLYLSPRDGFEPIYDVLKEFPDLTVILYNIGWWPSACYVYPLLKRYKNVYFETGDFSMMHGYEDVCARFGSERLLFGTNFPTNSMAGSIYCLEMAKISESDRENIAHANLERLLGEVKL